MRKFALIRGACFFKPPLKKVNSKSGGIIMATESQNLPFSLPAPLFRVPYTLRGSTVLGPLHLSRVLYKSTLFMQNKPNLLDAQMNVTSVITVDYENIATWKLCENKPNSKPIQTQSNPISEKPK